MDQPTAPRPQHDPEACLPIREMLARVGDKWTMVVIGVLGDKRLRFKELHRAIGNISERVMTVTLRNLERDGLLVRIVYPTVPPRVEYELSESGRSFRQALVPLGAWVLEHRKSIERARREFDARAEMRALPTLTKE